ncbi:MAG: hypothetical protein AAHH96_04670 [Candidatus Symbiodolus clandestinus]
MNIKFIAATLSFLGLGDREGNDSMAPNQRVPTKLITLEKLNLPTVIGGISLLGALSLLGYSISTSCRSHSRRRDLQIPCAKNSNLDQVNLRTQNDSSDVECTHSLQEQETPFPSFRLTNSAHTSPYSHLQLTQETPFSSFHLTNSAHTSPYSHLQLTQETPFPSFRLTNSAHTSPCSHLQLTQETPLPRLTSIAEELSLSCEQLAQKGKISKPGTSASETTPLISRLKQSVSSLGTADSGNDMGISIHEESHVIHRHVPNPTSMISPQGKLTADA